MTMVGNPRTDHACPGGAHGCSGENCGTPQLDLRTIRDADRRSRMHEALVQLRPGDVIVFLSAENPLAELYVVLDRLGSGLEVKYYEACPLGWRVAVVRRESGPGSPVS